MTRRNLIETLRCSVEALYGSEEARSTAFMVAEELYGVGHRELIVEPDAVLNDFDPRRFDEICRRLSDGCPAQYVTGTAEFCGMRFGVSPAVLIPRPETEELVMAVAAEYRNTSPRILDIGTGSGAIAVSLKKLLPEASVTAVDISAEAIAVAEANAARNDVEVNFAVADIFTMQPETGSFDVMVSNPPYVTESERPSMRRNVLDYEPSVALFVPDHEPLRFYRRIALFALTALASGGELWFEINERFGNEIARMLSDEGFDTPAVIADMNSKPRFVRCRKR